MEGFSEPQFRWHGRQRLCFLLLSWGLGEVMRPSTGLGQGWHSDSDSVDLAWAPECAPASNSHRGKEGTWLSVYQSSKGGQFPPKEPSVTWQPRSLLLASIYRQTQITGPQGSYLHRSTVYIWLKPGGYWQYEAVPWSLVLKRCPSRLHQQAQHLLQEQAACRVMLAPSLPLHS